MNYTKNSSPKIVICASKLRDCINFRLPLIKFLQQSGFEVYIFSPSGSEAEEETLKRNGITLVPTPLSRTGINPIVDIKYIINLFHNLSKVSPDVFLSYTAKPVLYGTVAAYWGKIPTTAAIIAGAGYAGKRPSSLKGHLINFIISKLFKFVCKKIDLVFFQNKDDRAEFISKFNLSATKSYLTNGTGVDVEQYFYTPVCIEEHLRFTLMARMLREKGIREYIDAAKFLVEKYGKEKIQFYLIGGIDENPSSYTQEELEEMLVGSNVTYVGEVDNVFEYLQATSVFVLPSYYREGIPRSILEAMAVGRPIVTTDNVGCRETVQHGVNGYLVPPRDVCALSGAMEKFIQNPKLITSMGNDSRKLAEKKFKIETVNSIIVENILACKVSA